MKFTGLKEKGVDPQSVHLHPWRKWKKRISQDILSSIVKYSCRSATLIYHAAYGESNSERNCRNFKFIRESS